MRQLCVSYHGRLSAGVFRRSVCFTLYRNDPHCLEFCPTLESIYSQIACLPVHIIKASPFVRALVVQE